MFSNVFEKTFLMNNFTIKSIHETNPERLLVCWYYYFSFINSNRPAARLTSFSHTWKFYNKIMIHGIIYINITTCEFTSVVFCVHFSGKEKGLNKKFCNLVSAVNYSDSYCFRHLIVIQASRFCLQENYFGLRLN